MGRRVRKPDWPGLLRETTAAGSTRFRVRVEGDKRKRITLPVGPGERGFEEAYWKARAGLQPDAPDEPATTPEAHRLDHLIDRYLAALEAKVAAGVASPGTLKGHRSLLRRASDVKDPLGRRIGSLSADLPREAFIAVMDSFGEHTAPRTIASRPFVQRIAGGKIVASQTTARCSVSANNTKTEGARLRVQKVTRSYSLTLIRPAQQRACGSGLRSIRWQGLATPIVSDPVIFKHSMRPAS
jgi:hypothetical protein